MGKVEIEPGQESGLVPSNKIKIREWKLFPLSLCDLS
jgi:hypothetical protein